MAGLFIIRRFARNLREEIAEEKNFCFIRFILMPDLGYEPGLYV